MELVRINNGQAVTSSRTLAENFGKEHKHVLDSIREILGYAENSADLFFKTTYVHPQNHQEYPEFLMNRDGFTLLAMGFTGTKALEWKLKYIAAFNEMEQHLSLLPDFTNPVVAARAWADEYEKRTIAESKVIELAPKAEYFDYLVDRNLLTNFRDTAKEFKMSQGDFIDWLLEHKYTFRDQRKHLKPYAHYVGSLFELKEYRKEANGYVGTQTLITPKGRETFRLLLKTTA